MKRINYTPYLIFIAAFLIVITASSAKADKWRSGVVKTISPLWKMLDGVKSIFASILHSPKTFSYEQDHLQLENQMLREEISKVREWLLFEERIEEQWERLKALSKHEESEIFWKDFFRRRSEQLAELVDLRLQSLPARVVFREPSSWSSSLWINVGERDNESLGKQIVAKNSPVVSGSALVGIVEFVGRTQSRVRLITDARLAPAVRAIRGGEQDRVLLEQVESLLKALELRRDLFTQEVSQVLFSLKETLLLSGVETYLAKGEVYGSSSQSMRSQSNLLKGEGFNYDYDDEEGSARDLRTGSILKVGDLLVTSGLDGFFPPGLHVGTVSKIGQLREGASSYELEAKAAAGNLAELTYLLVLPAIE